MEFSIPDLKTNVQATFGIMKGGWPEAASQEDGFSLNLSWGGITEDILAISRTCYRSEIY
jgi:hypothetical protein